MDLEILKDMLKENLQTKIDLLSKDLKANDFDSILNVAHQLKGNSGALALGYNNVNDLGKKLEKIAAKKDLPGIKKIIKELQTIQKNIR